MGNMSIFSFQGELSASKSLLNRALVAKSYQPDLKIIGDSECDDVQLMRVGLADLIAGRKVECGHAGTVLRFLALRASRIPGVHILTGSERLFSRPQTELLPILGQLGAEAKLERNILRINSQGWRLIVDGLQINAQRSSQFASAVILNAWKLKFPLHFHMSRKMVSQGYLRMSLELVRKLGMHIEDNGSEFFIPANQQIMLRKYVIEPDLSSAFAVAAMAVVAGSARIHNFLPHSLQPDFLFIRILQDMGADIKISDNELQVMKTEKLNGININLEKCPDLLPILGVLCALAKTPSLIEGVGHAQFKESARVDKTKELLQIMGATVESQENSLYIKPGNSRLNAVNTVFFDVDQDHRMVMAATVAKWAGYLIQVGDVKAVSKSFPEFLKITGDMQ
ncbi:MAG: hypothetical protein A2Z20_12450 [Bdellovibrionales bacterium RBG_16_40_8]|nr:MAG: hypothetical protein A2Z20_12450 [Bdellovibrionales bacterium RBG_16_40_8]